MHILYHADDEPIYGTSIKEELESHGYNISDGSLYPWLKRLTFSGLLTLEKRNVDGRIRKYYSITKLGKEELTKIKKNLKQLYNEVVRENET